MTSKTASTPAKSFVALLDLSCLDEAQLSVPKTLTVVIITIARLKKHNNQLTLNTIIAYARAEPGLCTYNSKCLAGNPSSVTSSESCASIENEETSLKTGKLDSVTGTSSSVESVVVDTRIEVDTR